MAPTSKDLGRVTVVSLAAAGAAEAVPVPMFTAFCVAVSVCAVAARVSKKITGRNGFKRIVASVRMVFRETEEFMPNRRTCKWVELRRRRRRRHESVWAGCPSDSRQPGIQLVGTSSADVFLESESLVLGFLLLQRV